MMKFIAPILAVLFLIASIGGYWYVYTDIQASAELVSHSRDQIAEIAARDAFAKAAAKFITETAADRLAVESFEIQPADTAGAIELVEDAAKVAKVTATVASANILALPEDHHERLDIVVSADGSFVGQARFATVLESLPRGAVVRAAHLEATDKGWYGTYTVSFIKIKAPQK